jgi:hypothetical protein
MSIGQVRNMPEHFQELMRASEPATEPRMPSAPTMAVHRDYFVDDYGQKSHEGFVVFDIDEEGLICGMATGRKHRTRADAEEEMTDLMASIAQATSVLAEQTTVRNLPALAGSNAGESEQLRHSQAMQQITRSGKAGALLLAASRSPENVREIAGQMLGRPVSVTVVASHRVFPVECHADGVMFPDGRVVIDSPFTWVRENQFLSAPTYQSIAMSHVVLPDGQELDWMGQEIGYEDISAADYADLQRRVDALEMAIARGEELPTTDALLARFQHVMDRSRWMIDMDSGKVIEARWDAESPAKSVAPYIVVSLPDGYNGDTLNFVGEPVERDGNQVKLKCAERGREYMIRWIVDADLQEAIDSQVANAKAWEYRDEKEGVSFQSLDRLPAEKRKKWSSERPLEAVPDSLVGLDIGASDQAEERAAKPRMRL